MALTATMGYIKNEANFRQGVQLMSITGDAHLNITLFLGSNFQGLDLFRSRIESVTLSVQEISQPSDLPSGEYAILIFDDNLFHVEKDLRAWRKAFAGELFVIATNQEVEADAFIPSLQMNTFFKSALENGIRQLHLLHGQAVLQQELITEHEKLSRLSHIGLALSAERDLNRLLTLILAEGRNWGCCDAASLFLVEKESQGDPVLVFKLTQNDSVSFPFVETKFPLDKGSISGFAAITGETVNIPDVYNIPEDTPYAFNNSFDESIHYRTRSVLTIPMKNHNDEVIGVLQFINRKTNHQVKLSSKDITKNQTLPFSEDITVLLKALASQAAVAIGNNILISRIQELFEGFVTAAVTAIEQRDPTTSGHSFRVAELTSSLAVALPRSDKPRLKRVRFDHNELTEIRYASLLHDFGKVGVKEGVLTKAKKLPGGQLDLIWHRFELLKEQLRHQSARYIGQISRERENSQYQTKKHAIESKLKQELDRLDRLFDDIARANEPTVLPKGTFNHLEEAKDWPHFQAGDRTIELLTDTEFMALSVRRGTLTESERQEIESHVVHTYNFLRQIPWTNELRRIPEIAVAHHEKLDGTGYPFGMAEEDIPLASRMMTIADIFDALTAADRPYKRSLGTEDALDILLAEASRGLLDRDLVDVFIEAKIFHCIHEEHSLPPSLEAAKAGDFYQRNVCDYEAHSHTAAKH